MNDDLASRIFKPWVSKAFCKLQQKSIIVKMHHVCIILSSISYKKLILSKCKQFITGIPFLQQYTYQSLKSQTFKLMKKHLIG